MAPAVTLLSVLVSTIPERRATTYARLMDDLERQARGRAVELLSFYDNRCRSVGAKRNVLLQAAQGLFCTFVDDDDTVAPDYLLEIMTAIRDHMDADVICYETECRINGGPPIRCQYSKDYAYRWEGQDWWGPPAHTMVWRTKLAQQHRFPDKMFGEDADFVTAAVADVRKEVQIPRTLYYYNQSNAESFTRGR